MKKVEPNYSKWHPWNDYSKDLVVEYRQCLEEGKDIAGYKALFEAVSAMPDGPRKAEMADVIYKIVMEAPQVEDYPYEEPSDLEGIFAAADGKTYDLKVPERAVLLDRIRGAWYGRICGCLLGKPVEGMRTGELTPFLQLTGNSPMYRYITKSDVQKPGVEQFTFPIVRRAYEDGVMDGMPPDDDTNYIVIAYKLLADYGRDFTPENMMDTWIACQPKNAYCTAERVAYRNFVNGYCPPESAVYKNPYREWIGAQIRGDFFGWVNPADPKTAADMAWRDASISHVKNGIYGEMWVAAMLAGAAAGAGIEESIRIGLSYIPKKSRLYEAIVNVIDAYNSGVTAEDFFADLQKRWDNYNQHDWCHTISNAEIVAAVLLYGEGDYGKTICMAVEQGFDTDCNGATAGSVLGMILGAEAIPAVWKDKIGGKLHTQMFGFETVLVDEMAEKTLDFLAE